MHCLFLFGSFTASVFFCSLCSDFSLLHNTKLELNCLKVCSLLYYPVENVQAKKNKRKLARLITQYRDIFFPIFRKARPSFFRVLQRMTKVFNVTSLKYEKYDITNEKTNNNK